MNIFEHFSKRTFTLIGILLLVTSGLIYLALTENTPQHNSTTQSIKVSSAHSILSLTELSASEAATFGKGVAVHIDTGSNKVTGVQFEIAYDPDVLANVRIVQGTFFQTPIVLINTLDPKNGRIFYALAVPPTSAAVIGAGTTAVITYTTLPSKKTTTSLTFLPKTVVTQEGTLESVLLKTNNLTIPLNPQIIPLIPVATGAAR